MKFWSVNRVPLQQKNVFTRAVTWSQGITPLGNSGHYPTAQGNVVQLTTVYESKCLARFIHSRQYRVLDRVKILTMVVYSNRI